MTPAFAQAALAFGLTPPRATVISAAISRAEHIIPPVDTGVIVRQSCIRVDTPAACALRGW